MARGNDVLLDRHVYVSVGVCGDCCVTTRQLPVARARICDGRGTGLGPRGRRGRVCVEMSCEPVSLSRTVLALEVTDEVGTLCASFRRVRV